MAEVPLMAGKSVLVTGGTGGIGRATATALAALGARVGITGRDPARTEAAAAGIRAMPGSPAVDAFAADMSVQAGVRSLAAQVLDTYPRLDVLVNNVGGFWAHRHVTADGLERTFALNHLAPFLLTTLLLDRLTSSAPARIVTVSSGAQARGRIDFDDLQGERNYSGQRAYSQSKLANVMFTYELARRLEGTGVTATVLHPSESGPSRWRSWCLAWLQQRARLTIQERGHEQAYRWRRRRGRCGPGARRSGSWSSTSPPRAARRGPR